MEGLMEGRWRVGRHRRREGGKKILVEKIRKVKM
jgi:hypothetical protein